MADCNGWGDGQPCPSFPAACGTLAPVSVKAAATQTAATGPDCIQTAALLPDEVAPTVTPGSTAAPLLEGAPQVPEPWALVPLGADKEATTTIATPASTTATLPQATEPLQDEDGWHVV